jgi:protein-S-isoprenylcysteine O-methyltransferase Ste14
MIVTSIVLFLVAALGGLYMAARIFGGSMPPWAVVIIHGVLAASGLLVLLYALFTGPQAASVMIGAILLVIAALGGFFMFSYQLRKLPPPKAIVVVHALAAVLGVVCLLANAVGVA